MEAANVHSEAIRAQLARILSSPTFSRANRSSQLLQFVVESTLAGDQQKLREHTIATQVFGRPDSFDPRIDSLVRVEVTRLRSRLQAYYDSALETGDIEIAVAPGTYVPTFESRVRKANEEVPCVPHEEHQIPPAAPRRRAVWLLVSAAALVLGAVFFALDTTGRANSTTPQPLQTLRRISIPGEVLAFPALSPGAHTLYFASNRGGGGFRIWKQASDGQAPQVLTPADSDAYDLDVSPDGAWIAYWSGRHGGTIYQQASPGGEELQVASSARSPRFSPDGKFIIYWTVGKQGEFGKVFISGITPGTHEREPVAVAGDFDDAHNPQWTPDQRILICGTRRTNVPEMEHDLWIVNRRPAIGEKEPIKTGIIPFLSARGIQLHPRPLDATSFRVLRGRLIFSGTRNGLSGVYGLRLSNAWQPVGEPLLLHGGSQSGDNPNVRDSLLLFSSLQASLNIWSLPLDDQGYESGPLRRLTQDEGEKFFPFLSADGRWLYYITSRPPNYEIWRRDIPTGVEAMVLQSQDAKMLKGVADGGTVFFRSLTGAYPQRQAIIAVESGVATTVCDDCGAPTSVSPRGEFVAFEAGSRIARIGVFDTRSRTKQDVLRHPHHAAQAARISPDGKWLAFELDRGVDGRQIMIAPFRGLANVPEGEWTPVAAAGSSFEPAWSPDGSKLYFISDRLGSRDLWVQRLDPGTKRPSGEPQVVHRFRNSNLNPLSYSERSTRYIGLSVGLGQAVLTLSELSSSLQLVRLP